MSVLASRLGSSLLVLHSRMVPLDRWPVDRRLMGRVELLVGNSNKLGSKEIGSKVDMVNQVDMVRLDMGNNRNNMVNMADIQKAAIEQGFLNIRHDLGI